MAQKYIRVVHMIDEQTQVTISALSEATVESVSDLLENVERAIVGNFLSVDCDGNTIVVIPSRNIELVEIMIIDDEEVSNEEDIQEGQDGEG